MATPNEVSEFDIMRQRIKERELQRGKQTAEQVKGQFAQRGTLRSGAQIKAQERGREQVATQAREERRDVLMAEAGIRRAEREAEAQRAFQRGESEAQRGFVRGEREAGQQFAGAQAQAQRGFITSERAAQQVFAAAQAEAQRSFTTDERVALQNYQKKVRIGVENFTTQERKAAHKFAGIEAQKQRDLQSDIARGVITLEDGTEVQTLQNQQFESSLAEQVLARTQNKTQFEAEMELNRKTTAINALNAMKNAGFSNDQIGTILNDLGISIPELAGGGIGAPDFVSTGTPQAIPPVGTSAPGLIDLGIS